MKKRKKKSQKKKKLKNKPTLNKKTRRIKKIKRSQKKILKKKNNKRRRKKLKIVSNNLNTNKAKKDSIALKLVKLQLSLKPNFNFKINFSLEKYIQGFFDKISETISNYKILKQDEKRKLRLEKIENERNIFKWNINNKNKYNR